MMNVAFFIYRRPDLTRRVFAEIAKARPDRLLVVADAARDETEREACDATRAIIDHIDWDCDVRTNLASEHLGCLRRVSGGLDWVFSLVEEAIIIEDDCLPDLTFFDYCSELLNLYRNDERVMHIAGYNPCRTTTTADTSYSFSRYPPIWGWATWRRAWQTYDAAIADWTSVKAAARHGGFFATVEEDNYWASMWDAILDGACDTWDHQWVFACRMADALCAVPVSNLVSNIGFGAGACHTLDASDSRAALDTCSIGFPLVHPVARAFDDAFDAEFARVSFGLPRTRYARLRTVLLNPHSYGGVIRRTPVLGKLWSMWRDAGQP